MNILINSKVALAAMNNLSCGMKGTSLIELSVVKDSNNSMLSLRSDGDFDTYVNINEFSVENEGQMSVVFDDTFIKAVNTLTKLSDSIKIELDETKAILTAGTGRLIVSYTDKSLSDLPELDVLGSFTIDSKDFKKGLNSVKHCIVSSNKDINWTNCLGIIPIPKDNTAAIRFAGYSVYGIAVSEASVGNCQFKQDMPSMAIPINIATKISSILTNEGGNVNVAVMCLKDSDKASVVLFRTINCIIAAPLITGGYGKVEEYPYSLRKTCEFKAAINKYEFIEALNVLKVADPEKVLIFIEDGKLKLADKTKENFVELTAEFKGDTKELVYVPNILSTVVEKYSGDTILFQSNGYMLRGENKVPASDLISVVSSYDEEAIECTLLTPAISVATQKAQYAANKQKNEQEEN